MASWVVEIYAWTIIWIFFDPTQPQQPLTEKVLKFNTSFDDSVKRFFFKTSKECPQIIEFKNLEHSEVLSVDFPGIRNLFSLSGLCSLTGLNSLWSPISPMKLPDTDDLIITGTKITNTGIFLWNRSSKVQFLLIYGTLCDGGCWGCVRSKKFQIMDQA